MTLNDKAADFLAQRRIAVAGVSDSRELTGNAIYKTLRDRGYEVFAIHPEADTVEGDPVYRSLQSIEGGLDGVVIITRPEITDTVVQDAVAAGVARVWMHDNTFMPGSVSDDAVALCKQNDITVIAGACPMMYLDFGHKCMRWVLGAMGRLPE